MTTPGSNPLRQPAFLWLQELLWPAAGTTTGGRRYAVLSRGNRPRLVVPLDSPAVIARSLRRTSADVSRPLGALRWAGSLGARVGLLRPFLRSRFDAGTPDDSVGLESWLAAGLDVPRIDIVATIGPRRPNRKPVLQLFSPKGETIGFAKVGWNGLTRSLVLREAEVLRGLAPTDSDRIVPPRLLHLGQWRGLDISVLSPLGPKGARRRVRRDPTAGELVELAGLSDRHRGCFDGSSYAAGLDARVTVLDHPSASVYASVLSSLTRRFGAVELEFGFFHGDWAPWNMIAAADHLYVWDWERARPDVPVLVDAVHYTFQRAWLRRGRSPADATAVASAGARHHADAFALTDDAVDLIVRLYLLELCLRYAENAAAGTDELRSGRHATVEAALVRLV